MSQNAFCQQQNGQNTPQNGQNNHERGVFVFQHIINAFHSQNAQSVKNRSISFTEFYIM